MAPAEARSLHSPQAIAKRQWTCDSLFKLLLLLHHSRLVSSTLAGMQDARL